MEEVLGERSYASVRDIPAGEGVEVVESFRRADQAGAHVYAAIRVGARAVWMQLGVNDDGGLDARQTTGGGFPSALAGSAGSHWQTAHA